MDNNCAPSLSYTLDVHRPRGICKCCLAWRSRIEAFCPRKGIDNNFPPIYPVKYYLPLTASPEIFYFLVQPFWRRDLVIMCCISASLFSRAIVFRRNWGSCEHIPLDVPICPPILTINYADQKVPVPSTVITISARLTTFFLSHQQKLTNTNNNRIDFSSLDLEIEEQSSGPNRSPPTPVRHESWGKEDGL